MTEYLLAVSLLSFWKDGTANGLRLMMNISKEQKEIIDVKLSELFLFSPENSNRKKLINELQAYFNEIALDIVPWCSQFPARSLACSVRRIHCRMLFFAPEGFWQAPLPKGMPPMLSKMNQTKRNFGNLLSIWKVWTSLEPKKPPQIRHPSWNMSPVSILERTREESMLRLFSAFW